MPSLEPFCKIAGISINQLSKEENYILEIEFFTRLCQELEEVMKQDKKKYSCLLKSNLEVEKSMLTTSLMQHIISDILLTKEYSIEGIAYYIRASEDVVYDFFTGKNSAPSFLLFRRILDLHKSVRPELYRQVMKKIAAEYLMPECNES